MNSLSALYNSEANLHRMNHAQRYRVQTMELNYNRGGWPPHRGTDHHWNLPDRNVGSSWWNRSPFAPGPNRGFAIDLNKNGRYDRGRDGVLAFDMNRNGRIDRGDVRNTNDMMKAATGNYDFNGDGRVTRFERIRGSLLRRNFQRLDRNRNGKLESWEISRGGGKVWVDHTRDGRINNHEVHSPYRIPGRFGSRRLDSVSPFFGSRTSSNRPWWQPFPMMPMYR